MRKLIVLGDSHLDALKLAADLGLLISDENEFCIVPGATAVGLRNPNSITDAINIFRDTLVHKDTSSYVLTHLGEVDCGFVIWWRAHKYGDPVYKQFKESLTAYQNFIEEISSGGYTKVCITAASLPTIRDGIDLGSVANKRSEIKVSLYDRTQLTLEYNSALREFANRSSVLFFDISNALLNKRENVVSDFFRNNDPTDHHLDKTKVCGIWALECNRFLSS